MSNVQLPMTNCQSNLYWIRYIWYMVTEIFVSTVAHRPACVTFVLTDNFFFSFFFFYYLFPQPFFLAWRRSTSNLSHQTSTNCSSVILYVYSMLPSFRTGPVFVQKELYLIIFVGHLNLRQPNNSKNKRNISAINCRFCRAFWRRSRSVRTISFEVSKSLAANICTFHCTVKVL